ncbi:MAG: hypothetical protein JKY65_26870 [Planctomycetes bacterium]|nr:hypothetical protein [Planctomycetota bacterium]
MSLGGGVLEFLAVCLASAFVCTAVKEDEDQRLARSSARLFGVLGGGILAFGLAIQALTWVAG